MDKKWLTDDEYAAAMEAFNNRVDRMTQALDQGDVGAALRILRQTMGLDEARFPRVVAEHPTQLTGFGAGDLLDDPTGIVGTRCSTR